MKKKRPLVFSDNQNILTLKAVLIEFEPCHEIYNNVVYATSKGSDQPVHTRSLIRAMASNG